MDSELVKSLLRISKPTRYLGDELNVVRKDLRDPDLIRFALAFPDIYDVGMSHLGLKILYQILNSMHDVWAERAYAPWIDMERKMRLEGVPLSSLESSSPLKDFHIIGFSLQYEMSYTSVLNMLDLAQIPLLSVERDSNHPLIIAGGPCVFNPEPMADFIDFFVIGDGEEVITEIVDCYRTYRDENREKLLSKMADIEGIYVPALVSVEEQPDGTLAVAWERRQALEKLEPDTRCMPIKKRIVSDLDSAAYAVDYLVPFMRPIHDRAIVEVMRGCSRGCRFCQAGMIYRPVRERSPAVVKRLAEEIIEKTGYEELSLSSLSTCDHSSICEIMRQLVESPGMEKHVSISLPSLRTDAFSVELARKLASIGKTGLTFAPEVATRRMQNVVNKRISEDEVISTVESAFSTGWDSLKLYFMIGLPTETEEDVAGIAYLVKQVLNAALRANKRASLNVSVSNFVPKAHTPFQWERQLSIDEVRQRQNLLIDAIGKNRRVNVSFHSPEVSYLEGVFARGDRRLGRVLRAAHELGCKLDGWTELFNFDAWMQAFAQCGVDTEVYQKARSRDHIMPWDHIDSGLTKDFLLAERDRAYQAELTPDCRWGKCTRCGVCDIFDVGHRVSKHSASSIQYPASSIEHPESTNRDPVIKIRFQFAKQEAVKFISHLDLLNTFTRAFRRAGVPVAYSQGFNPHPKISFGSSLPVGTMSEAEFADVELEEYMEVDNFVFRSNEQLPPGVKILKAQETPLREQPLMAQISLSSYIVRVPKVRDDLNSRLASILDMDHIWIERRRRSEKRSARRTRRGAKNSKFVDIKPLIRSIRSLGHVDGILELEMLLSDGKDGKVRPEEVIRLVLDGLTDDAEKETIISEIGIHKIGTFIEHKGQFFSPMETINQ